MNGILAIKVKATSKGSFECFVEGGPEHIAPRRVGELARERGEKSWIFRTTDQELRRAAASRIGSLRNPGSRPEAIEAVRRACAEVGTLSDGA